MSRVIFYSNFKMNGHNSACFQKNTRWLIVIKHKQSARIKRKNNLFKPCVRSKQPRTIKIIVCNDIFGHCFARKFSNFVATSEARIWLAICENYWPMRISDLFLSMHWINPLLHWINSLLHWITWKLYLNQSELRNFSM